MGIEVTTTTTTATNTTTKTAEKSSASAANSATKAEKSFKEELGAVKTQDASAMEATKTVSSMEAQNNETAQAPQNNNLQTNPSQKAAAENSIRQNTKNNPKEDIKTSAAVKNTEENDPISELSSKIATINELKVQNFTKTNRATAKAQDISDKSDISQTIKMDKADATFFLNLVQNQQNVAQISQNTITGQQEIQFNDTKTEATQATQSTAQVSQTLINALSDSMKTGKSFRIDFDNNIAVIMKVDKNGVLSANFIPGDAAVENYLRNNMAILQQNFDNQNLSYNSLSYSKHQRQDQQKQNQNKEKENE